MDDGVGQPQRLGGIRREGLARRNAAERAPAGADAAEEEEGGLAARVARVAVGAPGLKTDRSQAGVAESGLEPGESAGSRRG